jgi:hypothetical protein
MVGMDAPGLRRPVGGGMSGAPERTHRNPMLSFRFSGWFLFRFAERRFLGSLSKEPPRSTRVHISYFLSASIQAILMPATHTLPVRSVTHRKPPFEIMCAKKQRSSWACR